MKKVLAMLIAFSALITVAGCGTDKNKSTADQPNISVETTAPPSSEQQTSTQPVTTPATTAISSQYAGGTIGKIDINQLDFSSIASLDGTCQPFGCGTNVDDDNRPIGATSLQEKYASLGGLFIGEPTKNIYLTFDEGYENGYTSKILDVLKEKQCAGVFFVTMDYVEKNPDLIKRMIAEGHVVGNHSVHHLSMPSLSTQEAASEIADLHNYVLENFNYSMYLFRPPMGEFSEQTLGLTQKMGYKTTLWSFAYRDWYTDNQPDVTESFNKVVSAEHDGAIYLLHAVSSTNTTILGDVIDKFRTDGYSVGAIPPQK